MNDVTSRHLGELRRYCTGLVPGPLSDASELERLLSACWDAFVGDHGGMTGQKLLGRMEDAVWQPPLLTFLVERHGAFTLGSSRAEVQEWAVNLDRRTASLVNVSRRQLRPAQARLDLHPVAEQLAEAILAGRRDERLKWESDSRVRLLIGNVLPDRSAAKQTLSGRRRRLRESLARRLAPAGWVAVRANVFQREASGQDGPLENPSADDRQGARE